MYAIDVVTLSPAALAPMLHDGVVGRAWRRGLVRIRLWDLREFTRDPHRKVDDIPFGSGAGMVLMPQPVVEAAEHAIEARQPDERPAVLVMSASGVLFNQSMARELSRNSGGMVIVCGRYEGIDARVGPMLEAREVSIGDYVLSAGEAAAMVVIDAVVRLLPGALGDPGSSRDESFEPESELTRGLLEYPQFTRPRSYRGMDVPEVLLSGHHLAIAQWRRRQSLLLTWQRRPELLERAPLTAEERRLLEQWKKGLSAEHGTC